MIGGLNDILDFSLYISLNFLRKIVDHLKNNPMPNNRVAENYYLLFINLLLLSICVSA